MIKVKKRKILLLPGDGIGPEVTREVKKTIQWYLDNRTWWKSFQDNTYRQERLGVIQS